MANNSVGRIINWIVDQREPEYIRQACELE